MKKKIIFMNSNKAWGGGEKWHLQTAIALRNRNFDVSFICNVGSELEKKVQSNNFPFHSIKSHNLSFLNPFKILELLSHFKIIRPDAIILNLPSDVKLGGIAAKYAHILQIIYRRGMPHELRNTYLNRFLFKHILNKIISNSHEVKKSLLKNNDWLDEKKITVLPNSIPIPLTQAPLKKRDSVFVIGNLGRLVDQKGQNDLIEMAAYLKTLTPIPFEIQIAGDGPLKEKLQQHIKSRELTDVVKLMGHLEDVPTFLKKIDVLVFPSHFEGSSNVILETMTHSVPVIAYDIGPNLEVIEHGKDGLIVPLKNIEELTKATLKIMTDNQYATHLTENAWEKIQAFDEKKILDKLVNLLSNGVVLKS